MQYSRYITIFLRLLIKISLLFSLVLSTHLQAASYNTQTRELFLPSLMKGSKTWTDVTLKLNTDSTYVMQSGTETALAFICPGLFTQDTLELINTQTRLSTPKDINTLLGCHWIRESTTLTNASEFIPASSGAIYTWLDANCSSLNASFSNLAEGVLDLSISKKSTNCITGVGHPHTPYDLNSELFLVGLVKVIPGNVTATEVLIKFKADNKYELISYALSSTGSPALICDALKAADLDAISTTMSINEINEHLGCHWSQKISSNPEVVNTYLWSDYECNMVSVARHSLHESKSYTEHKSGGCGSFVAH